MTIQDNVTRCDPLDDRHRIDPTEVDGEFTYAPMNTTSAATRAELLRLRFGHGWRCDDNMPEESDPCPLCGEELAQEHANVEVGIIDGPVGCLSCGWSSWLEFDCSVGPGAAQFDMPGFYVDPLGGATRIVPYFP